jgi:hypothetical protein
MSVVNTPCVPVFRGTPNKSRRWNVMAKYEMLYLLNNDSTEEVKAAEIAKY